MFSIDSSLDLQEPNLKIKSKELTEPIDLSESDLNESLRKEIRSLIEQYRHIFAEDATVGVQIY